MVLQRKDSLGNWQDPEPLPPHCSMACWKRQQEVRSQLRHSGGMYLFVQPFSHHSQRDISLGPGCFWNPTYPIRMGRPDTRTFTGVGATYLSVGGSPTTLPPSDLLPL